MAVFMKITGTGPGLSSRSLEVHLINRESQLKIIGTRDEVLSEIVIKNSDLEKVINMFERSKS